MNGVVRFGVVGVCAVVFALGLLGGVVLVMRGIMLAELGRGGVGWFVLGFLVWLVGVVVLRWGLAVAGKDDVVDAELVTNGVVE